MQYTCEITIDLPRKRFSGLMMLMSFFMTGSSKSKPLVR